MTPTSYTVAKLPDGSNRLEWWLDGKDQTPLIMHVDHFVSPLPIVQNGTTTLFGRRDGKPHWVDVVPEVYTRLRAEVLKIFPLEMAPINIRGKPTIYGFRGLH